MLRTCIGRGAWLAITILGIALLANAQNDSGELQSFVGRKFILHSHGREATVKLKKDDLPKLPPGCDEAVEIMKASHSGDRLRFDLEDIGGLLAGRLRSNCKGSVTTSISLTISGIRTADLAAGLEPMLSNLFMTPEIYMSYVGVNSNLTPAPEGEPVVPLGPGVTYPVPLIQINPAYSDQARRAKLSGSVKLEIVVGTDGRIRSPNILTKLGLGLDEQVLRTLPLWRFEPARQNGKPVATKNTMEIAFHLY